MIEEYRSPLAQRIVASARQLVGTPFMHQGRDPALGLDCIGLARASVERVGLSVVDWPFYQRMNPNGERLIEYVSKSCVQVPIEEARWGDLLLMYWRRSDLPQHTMLRTPKGVIHASSALGKVWEEPLKRSFETRLHSAWAYREVEHSG